MRRRGVPPIHLRSPHGESDEHAFTRRRLVVSIAVMAAVALALYGVLPRVAGLDETWGRLSRGDPWWFAVALVLEAGSYGGYMLLFHGAFTHPGSRLGWRETYQVTMAGAAATRVLAAGGAGGIALTAWAMSRAGMHRALLLRRLTTFYVALYSVYMLALVVVGFGLRSGALAGPRPFGVTVVPAAFGLFVIAGALLTALLPHDLDRRVGSRLEARPRLASVGSKAAAAAAAIAAGVRGAVGMVRAADPALLGALAWWCFDIAALWACFHAFGEPPSLAVVVMAYFTGMLGNLLPVPGGVGGVEGGMIGAFIAFNVSGGLAVVAVLAYRAFAFWLPSLLGLAAYLQLRRTVRGWRQAPPM